MHDNGFEKLTRERTLTPNVPPFERQVYNDGKKAIAPAPDELRSLAQNLIDETNEHRHLRSARVLLLVETSEAMRKKLAKGERVAIGKASKATPLMRVLTSGLADKSERKKPKTKAERELDPPLPGFDFVVKVSGDWLDTVGYHGGDEEGIKKALALLDHELLHCGVRIAGTFLDRKRLAQFVKDLAGCHIETCDDIQDDKGRVLVRYQVRDPAGRYTWALRRHDVEEFCGVVARWGAWDRAVGRLVDVIVEAAEALLPEKPQTAGAAVRAAAKSI